MSQLIGLLPGTFDPITKGHTDIIIRASKFVDHLVVGVAVDVAKDTLFSQEDRLTLTQEEIKNLSSLINPMCTIEVRLFSGLLVEFSRSIGAKVILRGLRAVSDFEYEFQMAGMNSYLSQEIETIFLMSSDKYQFISSRFVKEIARLGGDISSFVSTQVEQALQRKFLDSQRRKG